MKNLALLVSVVFLLFSCNSGNKESSSASDDSKETTSKSSDTKAYDCLEKYVEDYSGLLTKEDMISVHPFDLDEAKVELSAGNYGSHIYSWRSDRPEIEHKVSGMKMMLADMNTMGVALLSFASPDNDMKSIRSNFDMAYKQLSDAELKQIDDNLNKQKDDIKETGKKMMKARGKSSWEFVDGLGNSAWYKWNDRWGGELAVLAGRAKFYIRLKVSDDPDENRVVAEKLAEKVLEKCH